MLTWHLDFWKKRQEFHCTIPGFCQCNESIHIYTNFKILFVVYITFAYVVPEDEASFTKYIEVTLNSYRSGVLLDGVMKICPEPF